MSMERPLEDVRPLGPFAVDSNDVVFKSVHTVRGLGDIDLDVLEDNLEDAMYNITNEAKDVDVSSGAGSNMLTVRVMYEGDTFSDSLEEKMLTRMARELDRLGAGKVETQSYEYIF